MFDTSNKITIMLGLDRYGDEAFVRAWLDTWVPFADDILIPDIETEDESRTVIDNYEDPEMKIRYVGKDYAWDKDFDKGWFANLLPSEFMSTHNQKLLRKELSRLPETESSEISYPVLEFYFDFNHYTMYRKPYFYRPQNIAYPYFEWRSSIAMFKYYLIGDSRVKKLLTNYGRLRYFENVWRRWENTRSVDEAMRGNLGFPHVDARINEGRRIDLFEFSFEHPQEIQNRLEYYKQM